jgi:hypothetical protein
MPCRKVPVFEARKAMEQRPALEPGTPPPHRVIARRSKSLYTVSLLSELSDAALLGFGLDDAWETSCGFQTCSENSPGSVVVWTCRPLDDPTKTLDSMPSPRYGKPSFRARSETQSLPSTLRKGAGIGGDGKLGGTG